MMKIDEVETNSEQLREVLDKPNPLILRSGITVIFVIMLIIFSLLWIIKFPDVIEGGIELTTQDPPIKLVNKNDSEIKRIYFDDNQLVKKGDVLLESKNTLDGATKRKLEVLVSEIREKLTNNNLSSYMVPFKVENYGVVQDEYAALITSIVNYQNLNDPNNTPFKLLNLKEQLRNTQVLRSIAGDQTDISEKQLARIDESFKSDKLLYEKGVISKEELNQRANVLSNQQNELKNNIKSKVQYDVRIAELKKEINDTELEFRQNNTLYLSEINERLSAIEHALQTWEMNYQITAPFDGKLTYLGNLKSNQYIQQGEEVFTLVPNTNEYVGLMRISRTGYGKVKNGQKVRIKLDNYPDHEFGLLRGEVEQISIIPNEDMYLVKIRLKHGLTSSYGKELRFTPEMSGSAEIITEELRLIDRIFYRIRTIFSE